jgi:putative hydrolase of the HAD superfamily
MWDARGTVSAANLESLAVSDYEVLLLDFGGVCLVNPVELHGKAEALLGLASGSLKWLGPLDPSTDGLWERMIANDGIDERAYWTERAKEVGRAAGRELSRSEYMKLLYDPPGPELVRPEALATVQSAIAAGRGVSVLTNDMRAFHGPDWEKGVPFLQLVDHIVDCSDTAIYKPDPRAFSRAEEMIGVPLDRMLFVDDQPLNVQGAIDVGLDAMWFDIANAADSWAEVAVGFGLES